jgi:hypothetical protein
MILFCDKIFVTSKKSITSKANGTYDYNSFSRCNPDFNLALCIPSASRGIVDFLKI